MSYLITFRWIIAGKQNKRNYSTQIRFNRNQHKLLCNDLMILRYVVILPTYYLTVCIHNELCRKGWGFKRRCVTFLPWTNLCCEVTAKSNYLTIHWIFAKIKQNKANFLFMRQIRSTISQIWHFVHYCIISNIFADF